MGERGGGGLNHATKQSENEQTDRETEAVINLHLLRTSPETSQVQVAFKRQSWRKKPTFRLRNAKFLNRRPQKTRVGRSRADGITLMCNTRAGVRLCSRISCTHKELLPGNLPFHSEKSYYYSETRFFTGESVF